MRLTLFGICLSVMASPAVARDLAVALDGVELQRSCGAPGAVATLPKGHVVTLRYSFAGADTRCYSVRTEIDGAQVTGYVSREALAGIDSVEQERRAASTSELAHTAVESIGIAAPSAASPGAPAAGATVPAGALTPELRAAAEAFQAGRAHEVEELLSGVPKDNLIAAVLRGSAYLRLTRPVEAQTALAPALRAYPNDPGLLGLAGVAAFQQDKSAEAARLLERSVKARPNPALEQLLARIKTERATDQSDDKTFGSRFVLRYDGDALPQGAARNLVRELDRELPAISNQLGCQVRDRLTVVVRTMKDYRAGAGPTEWSAGHYDGRIHVALGANDAVDERVRETFRHEMVHACLARRGQWPTWLQEGLAEYVAGRRLGARERQALVALNSEGNLPSLNELAGAATGLSSGAARTLYFVSLAAAEIMYQDLGDYGVRKLIANPAELPDVTARLDGRLRQTLR